jgi:hypothetical protein
MRITFAAPVFAACLTGVMFSALPAWSQQVGMAKFQSSCFGDAYYVVRISGYPDNPLRFTLGIGQKIHFQIPRGSTYAVNCGGWPGNNTSWNSVNFE